MTKLIGKKTVAERIGYHPESIMRLAREGKFPKPFKLTDARGAAVRWDEAVVDAWIAERAGQMETAPPGR